MFTIEELVTIPLFSQLGDKELEFLAGAVEDLRLSPGEYVGHEGEARFLVAVVEGKTELTKQANGAEQV
ncbi:MAG TPA: pyridine nucleotide-disulfide oxidoreductase, partial [Mycobacterium sp.]|nr:pyridine nucleotide-disulfide oxidoreductase [Mycobacterium sp.]